MKTCSRCGNSVGLEDKYCSSCGISIAPQENIVSAPIRTQKIGDIRFNLGMIYFNMGEFDDAIETFEAVLNEDPGNRKASEMCEQAREKLAALSRREN